MSTPASQQNPKRSWVRSPDRTSGHCVSAYPTTKKMFLEQTLVFRAKKDLDLNGPYIVVHPFGSGLSDARKNGVGRHKIYIN